ASSSLLTPLGPGRGGRVAGGGRFGPSPRYNRATPLIPERRPSRGSAGTGSRRITAASARKNSGGAAARAKGEPSLHFFQPGDTQANYQIPPYRDSTSPPGQRLAL